MAKIFKWNPNQTATGTGVSVATVEDTATGIVEGVGMGCERIATKTATGRDGILYSTLTKEPAMTLKDSVLVASLEGESANLYTYSEDFSQSYWNKSNVSIDYGYTSPDGKNTATKVTITGSGFIAVYNTQDQLGNQVDCSFYVKSNNGTNQAGIRIGNTTIPISLSNEWERYESDSISDNNVYGLTFTGDIGDVFYIYGAQLEIAKKATSYIPTNGSTQTRDADVGFKTPDISSLINLNSGVLEVEMAALVNGATNRRISLNDGSSDNKIDFYFNTSLDRVSVRLNVGGIVTIAQNIDNVVQTDLNTYKLGYKSGEVYLDINGINVWTDNTIFAFAKDINNIRFSDPADVQHLEANINYLKFTSND